PFVMNVELNWRNPGYEQNNGYPVTCLSWQDAQEYVAWLSKETHIAHRLPSEAEWEYVARSGQSTAYFWGSEASNDQANYGGKKGKDQWDFAAPVGRFPANKFSIQDTSGNLWEWVQDCWHPTYHGAPNDGSAWEEKCHSNEKVRRGGGWDANAAGIRSAIRSPGAENDRSNLYGFRVARDWQNQPK
ncbi:MAG: formylglycine-generating enzyme family protein, partial [Leucothrix sp.]